MIELMSGADLAALRERRDELEAKIDRHIEEGHADHEIEPDRDLLRTYLRVSLEIEEQETLRLHLAQDAEVEGNPALRALAEALTDQDIVLCGDDRDWRSTLDSAKVVIERLRAMGYVVRRCRDA